MICQLIRSSAGKSEEEKNPIFFQIVCVDPVEVEVESHPDQGGVVVGDVVLHKVLLNPLVTGGRSLLSS